MKISKILRVMFLAIGLNIATLSYAETVDISAVTSLAQSGDVQAQYELGLAYLHGEGVKEDYLLAKQWLEQSANANFADAQTAIGEMYFKGIGVEQDYQQAKIWFEKSAKQGNPYAEHYLGMMYLGGLGVEYKPKQAEYWFKRAVKQDLAEAKFALGELYFYSHVYKVKTKMTKKEILSLYQQSAEQGFAPAQYKLGIFYQTGIMSSKSQKINLFDLVANSTTINNEDMQKAIIWLETSAVQGYVKAQHQVGLLLLPYENTQDKAKYWLDLACKQDNVSSCLLLENLQDKAKTSQSK